MRVKVDSKRLKLDDQRDIKLILVLLLTVRCGRRPSIFVLPFTLDQSRLFWADFEPSEYNSFFRIYKMTAECEKTQQRIILRNIELNLQTKFIEQLKHMIGTDFNTWNMPIFSSIFGIDFIA